MTVTLALAARWRRWSASRSTTRPRRAIAEGRARERFVRWAEAQGGDPAWLAAPRFPLAPVEAVIEAPRGGVLAAVDTRQLGLLLAEAGGASPRRPEPIDFGVALRTRARLGHRVERGDELARLHLRRDDPALVTRVAACCRRRWGGCRR
jgi:thymidine phosphorylase